MARMTKEKFEQLSKRSGNRTFVSLKTPDMKRYEEGDEKLYCQFLSDTIYVFYEGDTDLMGWPTVPFGDNKDVMKMQVEIYNIDEDAVQVLQLQPSLLRAIRYALDDADVEIDEDVNLSGMIFKMERVDMYNFDVEYVGREPLKAEPVRTIAGYEIAEKSKDTTERKGGKIEYMPTDVEPFIRDALKLAPSKQLVESRMVKTIMNMVSLKGGDTDEDKIKQTIDKMIEDGKISAEPLELDDGTTRLISLVEKG